MNIDREWDEKVEWPVEIEQYERKIYDLKQLIEISKGLNSTLEYNTLIESILLTCMGQMQLLNAGIFIKKGISSSVLKLHRNYKGFEPEHIKDYSIKRDSSLIRFLETSMRCFTIDEILSKSFTDGSDEILKRLNPDIIVPLSSKGQINGIIVLGDRIVPKPFSETEKEYLLDIASLAGIAINNAALYEMATTDMMTRLKIRHYYQTVLEEEFSRSRRLKWPLSVIFADVDRFKQFNDEHGHAAGDDVLVRVARVLADNIRTSDTAARIGGEEFAVILPKTDIMESLIVAERIRSSIESEEIEFKEEKLRVTVSIGLSQLDPDNDNDYSDMTSRADRALYLSKNGGRNTVSML